MHKIYPIFLNLKNKKIVMIGGGCVAYRKARDLHASGANITVISPEICENLKRLVATNKRNMRWIERRYQRGDLQGALLAFALTSNKEVNMEIKTEANDANIPVNMANSSHLGDFYGGDTWEEGNLMLAISTHGYAPILIKYIKEHLQKDEMLKKFAHLIPKLWRKKEHLRLEYDDNAVIAKKEKLREFTEKMLSKIAPVKSHHTSLDNKNSL